ncbi:MAG: magnesium transporter [Paracoccus sp. (in: a-proteobacteria)]
MGWPPTLTQANALQVVRRELAVGLTNGVLFGVVLGTVTYIWFQDPKLSLVIGMAMIVNLFAAALGGILIPLGLEKAGADPALASGTFVTTVTDVLGFFTFLGLATAILL